MYFMFYGATNFNQDISGWDVSNVTNMEGMLGSTALSDENKCAIHTAFSSNGNWPYDWSGSCPAIFDGTQNVISNSANGAYSVYAVDVDGDGNMDVLSASDADDTIAWYENDGNGNFSPHDVTTSAAGAVSVYAADVDGDGDMDVLSASSTDNTIAWYENDGSGNFGDQNVITTSAAGAVSVYAADVDGDGDMDVLSASSTDDTIAWYENDGSGNFGDQNVITTSADYTRSVYAVDMDGDGDIDVLSASRDDNTIAWYENDGSGNFGDQNVITTSAEGARSVYAADVDGDGDMDVLSASSTDDTIAWYENDGSGNFGDQNVITTSADNAHSVYAADVDGDGDMDVLSASDADDTIAWYENDGSGNFGDQNVITTSAEGARSVYAADVDGDGDMDVLSASSHDGTIAWYENTATCEAGFSSCSGICFDYISHSSGDVNQNGDINVIDLIIIVGNILYTDQNPLTAQQFILADFDQDCNLSITDIVGIVGVMFEQLARTVDIVEEITIYQSKTGLYLESPGFVALDIKLSHQLEFEHSLTSSAFLNESNTTDYATRMIIVEPQTQRLFETNDDFIIDNIIAVGINGEPVEVSILVMPTEFNLSPAYPNPFNPVTTLKYSMPYTAEVSLTIYDIMGREVEVLLNENIKFGYHSIKWNATRYSSGIYFVHMVTKHNQSTQKLMLIK